MDQTNNIRTVTAFRCDLGAEGKSNTFYRYRRVVFRKDGKPIRETIYSQDGLERAIILFTYDDQARLAEKETLHMVQRNSEKTVYRYDAEGKKQEEVQYYNGALYDRCEWSYTAEGQETEWVHYDEDNVPFERDVFHYNPEGRLEKKVHLDDNKEPEWELLMEYDSEGQVVREINNRIKEQRAELTRYVYNEKGLKVKSETYGLDKQLAGTVEITYDEADRPIRYLSETFGMNPTRMVNQIVYDEEGRALSSEFYDIRLGQLVLREAVKYDAKGNIIEEEMYDLNTEEGNKLTHYILQMAYEYYLPESENITAQQR